MTPRKPPLPIPDRADICAVRQRLGLTHEQFARKVGICKKSSVKYAKGYQPGARKCTLKLNRIIKRYLKSSQ